MAPRWTTEAEGLLPATGADNLFSAPTDLVSVAEGYMTPLQPGPVGANMGDMGEWALMLAQMGALL